MRFHVIYGPEPCEIKMRNKKKKCFGRQLFLFQLFVVILHTVNHTRKRKQMSSVEQAFQKYYRPLCLYAMHYLSGDVDRAEDVVQDCFVKLWQKETVNDRSFLYTAVRNACIDQLRRNDPLCRDVQPQDLEGAITDSEAQDRSLLEARLWQAIDDLPARQRQALLICKRDGATYREAAQQMGISEKTVEHLIASAMKSLRRRKADILYLPFLAFA